LLPAITCTVTRLDLNRMSPHASGSSTAPGQLVRKTPSVNTLFYGDNLHILREYVEDESVDLVYLDPPFNSNATYNVLFKAPTGE
jgi:16S rRNA G966 N2-methylase RsmD